VYFKVDIYLTVVVSNRMLGPLTDANNQH